MDKLSKIEDQSTRMKSTWQARCVLHALVKAADHAPSIRSCGSYPIEAQIINLKSAIKIALDAATEVVRALAEHKGNTPFVLALALILICSSPAAAQSQYFRDYAASGQISTYTAPRDAPAWGPANPYPPAPPPAGSGWGSGDSAFAAGALPYYRYPRMLSDPGIPGSTVFLMPDGGTWTINPPAIDGFLPPPIYTPPDRDDYYRHHRRGRRY
jgi:hypothetical protein